jgi:pyruvate carboxylase
MIAGGASLDDLELKQSNINANGFAIQARVTTEDPK